MKTNETKSAGILFAAAVLAFAAGCATKPAAGSAVAPTVSEMLSAEPVVVNVQSAGGGARAGGIDAQNPASKFIAAASPFKVFSLEGGHKRAQMRVRNATSEDFGVSYVVSWFDKDGAEILTRPAKSIRLKGRSTAPLTDVCTEKAGVSAEIEIHLIPAENIKETKLTFENASKILVDKFSSDAQFLDSLKKVQDALGEGKKPVMVVRSLDDNSGGRNDAQLQTLAKGFRIEVRKTGFLDVKDDAAYQAITDRLVFSADGGLERSTMLEAYGTHVPPDFILTGELRPGEDRKSSVLFLTLHDISGASGRGGVIAWEDKAPIGD